MRIAIIRTATANLASVNAAFARLGVRSRVVTEPSEIETDDAIVLPGVGAFAAGMQALTRSGWDRLLTRRFEEGAPTLAICLGFQLLCQSSEESPGVRGLGLLPAKVRRLPDDVIVPHFGWNRIESPSDFLEDGYVYYANSYCSVDLDALASDGWEVAATTHGIGFVAAVRREALVACQFHPELSGVLGSRLLSRWVEAAAARLQQSAPMASESGGCSC